MSETDSLITSLGPCFCCSGDVSPESLTCADCIFVMKDHPWRVECVRHGKSSRRRKGE
jgi:hypothetical protein